jgi:hypothetical protein
MIDSNQALLLRKTGKDVRWWAGVARAQGFADYPALAGWLTKEHGLAGYAREAVLWEVFGPPPFMLRDADELFEGQYADRLALRPIGEAILAWAGATEGVVVQMRKTYVSLQSARRKFAQVAPVTKTSVDVTLRWTDTAETAHTPDRGDIKGGADTAGGAEITGVARAGAPARLEPVAVRAGDPFTHRIRLRTVDDADEEFFAILTTAFEHNR